MNDIPDNFKRLLRAHNEKLSDASIKTRWSQFKTICRAIGVDHSKHDGCNADLWHYNLSDIETFINSLATTDSKQNYTVLAVVMIKAIMKVLERAKKIQHELHKESTSKLETLNCDKIDEIEGTILIIEKQLDQLSEDLLWYNVKMAKLKEIKSKEKEQGSMTKKQKDNFIEYRELEKQILEKTKEALDKLMSKERGEFTTNDIAEFQRILLCRLMLVAPSRTDFGDLKIIRTEKDIVPKDTNYLYLAGDDKYIHLNKWKTKKDEGEFRRISLKSLGEVSDIICRYCDMLLTKKHVFESLGYNKEAKAMSASVFSKYVSNCFSTYIPDRRININLLRHIIVTHNKDKINEVAELQNTLGHGAATQKSYILNGEI